jgi:hypothetical protein
VLAELEAAGIVTLADKGYQGTAYAKLPCEGRKSRNPQKQANKAHDKLRGPGERANAQLKIWHILRKLRCCPWRAGKLARGHPRIATPRGLTRTKRLPVCCPSVMPDTDNEPQSAAGGRLPTGLQRATGAQIVVIVAGVIVVAGEFLPYRIVGYTTMNPGTGSSWWPDSITLWSERLALAPAGASVLAAVAGLALRRRPRWLRYLQIGLWLLALASSVYITRMVAPFTGLEPLYGPIIVGGAAGVVAVALLTRSLRRPSAASRAGTWRSSCWRRLRPVSRLPAARDTPTGRAPVPPPGSSRGARRLRRRREAGARIPPGP